MYRVRAPLVAALLVFLSGYSSAQDHGCKIPDSVRVKTFTSGEIDQLQQFSAALWPHDSFKLRDFVANPELQYISASAYVEITSCSSRVSFLQSMLPKPKLDRSGFAKITAKILKAAGERNRGKFDSRCVVPIAGLYRRCMNEVVKLSNNSFKPTPLRGAA